MIDREQQMAHNDQLLREVSDRRNHLETGLQALKAQLDGALRGQVSSEVRRLVVVCVKREIMFSVLFLSLVLCLLVVPLAILLSTLRVSVFADPYGWDVGFLLVRVGSPSDAGSVPASARIAG